MKYGRERNRIGLLALLWLIAAPAWAGEPLVLQLKVEGAASDELRARLEDARKQRELQAQDAMAASEGIARSMRFMRGQQREYFTKLLHSQGYHDGQVEEEIEGGRDAPSIALIVRPGQRYIIGGLKVALTGEAEKVPAPEELALKPGAPAEASRVLEEQQSLTTRIDAANCLFSLDVTHEAVVDHLARTVSVTYLVKAGPKAHVNGARFEGLASVSEAHAQKLAGLKKDACFRRSVANDARVKLQESGLFASAQPVLPEAPADDGGVTITYKMKERAHRTLKAGANYSTDVGPGVTGGWEHRNLLGGGEKLTGTARIAQKEQSLDALAEKPFFWRDDQTLKLGTTLKREDSDAYVNTGFNVSGSVERTLTRTWKAGLGATYGFNRVKDQQKTENFVLLSLPAFAAGDKRNDLLDPTKGWTLRFEATPFIDTADWSTAFYKLRTAGTYYLKADLRGKPVLALRAATGSILGIPTKGVPATERFYAGGAGSVRGYGYQLLGPLDAQKDPLGGRSYIETSAELRVRATGDIGLVAFLDGGNAFDATAPDLEGGMLWGAGVGVRYFTSFGPLRADIAMPLDRRPGVDDSFQLYFSIGQAF